MHTLLLWVPQPCSRPPPPMSLPEAPGHAWASLGQSLVGLLLLSPGSCCTPGFVCALLESASPVLWKFWRLCGGVKVTSSKRAYAIPRSAAPRALPCSRPLLIHTSTGYTQTQFWLSLCGVIGSCCAQSLFEPSECLWWLWGLILNVISPLLPSCWGFSFALGRGVSFLVGSNIFMSMVVQEWVVNLEFL